MRLNKKKLLPSIILSLFFLSGAIFLHPRKLFFINNSPSVSCGIFFVSSQKPSINDYVIIDTSTIPYKGLKLPPSILKRLAFDSEEKYSITNEYLSVGNLRVKKYIFVGMNVSSTLNKGQAILIGNNRLSLDSRYFGPVNYDNLVKAIPVLIWTNMGNTYE